MMGTIPVSILIATYNEENNIGSCLQSLDGFDDVIVIDSNSTDRTQEIAEKYKTQIIPFEWNGQYPKKRQWVLDQVKTKYDYILWLDADERVISEFIETLKQLNFSKAGYFVQASYIWNDKVLRYGLKNKKLALMHREQFVFPVVDDLTIKGMGEIEGHYQPVLKAQYKKQPLGFISVPYLHDAYQDPSKWEVRHEGYAEWEAQMRLRDAYPDEDAVVRRGLKSFFRALPLRHWIAFLHSYVLKLGFLDGAHGLAFAKSRAHYYRLVRQAEARLANQ